MALRRPSLGRQSELQRRRVPGAGAGDRRPGAAQPEFRLPVRRQEAFHPVGRELESPSGRGPRRELGAAIPDVRAAVSRCHQGRALPLERAQHRGPAIPPPEASRDVRRAEVRRGGQPAVRRACCPEPALRSAQVLSSVRVSLSEREWLPAQVHRGGLQAPRALALAWAQAWAAPQEPLWEAEVSEPDVPPEAGSSARAAGPRREAVPAAWAPDVPRAAQEAAVSGRAAAGPRPEAAQQASEQQAVGVAAAQPDELRAEAVAEAALQGAPVRQPAEAQRAGGAVQRRAAVQRGARARQAAWPQAGPSAAASVFRQGPSLAVGPAQPRAAKRSAHAMQCWPIASR